MKSQSVRLDGLGTTIFAEMSALAQRTGAINLGQGFPDTDGPDEVIEAAVTALRTGHNQYTAGLGIAPLRHASPRPSNLGAAHRGRGSGEPRHVVPRPRSSVRPYSAPTASSRCRRRVCAACAAPPSRPESRRPAGDPVVRQSHRRRLNVRYSAALVAAMSASAIG